jgi:hypothetical protein
VYSQVNLKKIQAAGRDICKVMDALKAAMRKVAEKSADSREWAVNFLKSSLVDDHSNGVDDDMITTGDGVQVSGRGRKRSITTTTRQQGLEGEVDQQRPARKKKKTDTPNALSYHNKGPFI